MIAGALRGQQVINGINWFPIGPADIFNGQTYNDGRINASGRASVIAVNPSNPNDVWLGTASGGVWHSTNSGANWLPMSDNEASLAIGALALDGCSPSGCAVIYAGTGENSIRRDTYYGMGLLIGQASGPSFHWSLKGGDLFRFASINNVLLDPSTAGASKTIYVSLSSGVTASATESSITAPEPPSGYGIYKSTDAGSTWAKLDIPGTAGSKPTDLEMDPTDGQTLYAGFMGRGIFKTTNGGTTWCPLNPGIPSPAGCIAATGLPDPTTTTFDHVEISIFRPSPAIPAVLYVILGNCPDAISFGCFPSLYKSADNGGTWTRTNAAAPVSYSRYTHVLTIHPKDSSSILYGGLKLHTSTDSGQTFVELGSGVHPDHHAIVFPDPVNPNRLYDTSDGGFASSTDGGLTWTSGNTDLQISGFHSVATSPLTARIIGGTQDNGTNIWLGTRLWQHSDDGDSGFTVLDRDDVLTFYNASFSVYARRSTDGGVCCLWQNILTGIDSTDPGAIYPPLVQDLSAPHPLYFGTNRLYQSTNKGDSWTAVSPVLGGTAVVFPDIATTNVITAVAVAPSNGSRIYVGYYDGQMFATDGACASGTCWRAVGGAAKGLPMTVITRIAVDPSSSDIAYATYSGFGGGSHLFKTANGGVSWSAVGKGLPDIPANTVTIETSSILWVGTDDGVYRSADGGASFVRFGVGLPRVPVYEIAIDRDRGRLYAATHGRGIFLLTQPFLNNFEGWVNDDIWDIPVYGNGFAGNSTTPPGSLCTMQIIQRDGTVCATSSTDVMGGIISFDSSGELVTSKGGFYNGKPVAWACFSGSCIGGKTIAACNPSSNPITAVTVTCGSQVGIDNILGCPVQANPPSSILGLSGMPTAGAGAGTGSSTPTGSEPLPGAVSFELIPSVQGRSGTRPLCTSKVSLPRGGTPLQALLLSRDAVNANAACRESSVNALVRGIPPQAPRGEDLAESPANLILRAPAVVGGQLFSAVRAPAGSATGVCFNVAGIGSPLRNQVAVMKIDFETLPGGAAGGELTVFERSSLGVCSIHVHTDPGESAAQIATAVANAFQAPGVPGPRGCPAIQNPRDMTVDGSSIVSVLASELRVCNTDRGVGFFLGPKELSNTRHLPLQYSAKFVCGTQEHGREAGRKREPWDGKRLARGTYFTTVNVHNPIEKTAAIQVKFASTLPNGKPGPISRFFLLRLEPDQVISLDCSRVLAELRPKSSLVDGFAVLESEGELDVVAVYTAEGARGHVESLSLERIPARSQ